MNVYYYSLLFFSFLLLPMTEFYCSTKDRIVKDVNMVLDIAINTDILNTEPIDINKYLTEAEEDMKDKAILNNFLNTWTGKRPDFQNQIMIECGNTWSGRRNYEFSHKDDVRQLRSDFKNIEEILKKYNLFIQFGKFGGKKTDWWGTGRSDDFINYQNSTLWWQIDKVTKAIWKVLMYMQIKYEKIITAQEINNFINALENYENEYNAMMNTIDSLKKTIQVTNIPNNTTLNLNNNNTQEIYFLLEEYALKSIKNEIYKIEALKIATDNKEKIDNLTKNISDYEKKESAWDCPANYLIQFKGDQYKNAGRTISEKLVPRACN